MENGHQFIENINKNKFRIPKYQRGYRWTEENVKNLLKDIYENRLFEGEIKKLTEENCLNTFNEITFEGNDLNKPKSTYCIQPLVVMKTNNPEDSYDVIDGQQRLTTIAIIRAALKKVGGIDSIKAIEISYESREYSGGFIKKLYSNKDMQGNQNDNIDFDFMRQAYETAIKFYEDIFEDSGLSASNDKIKKDYATYLDNVLCKNTQFIWYCVKSEDPQKIFANFNTGKIELTNSELIKALFMDPTNYNTSNIKDKQIVISEKWDEIENKLREPEFWAFVPHPLQYKENNEKYCTRIDIIFEYLVMEIWYQKNPSGDYQTYRKNKSSDKYIFNEVENYLKNEQSNSENKEEIIDTCWRWVSKIFSGLKELFSYNNKIYNMVGLYINLRNRAKECVDRYITDSSIYLSVYKDLLDVLKTNRSERESKLKAIIKKVAFVKNDIANEIKKIKYSEGNSYEIVKILIIYNIALLNTSKGTGERFSFLENAKNQWEREHIFASNVDEKDVDDKTRIAALEVLAGNSYINYVKELFPDLKETIQFIHEGYNIPLDIKNISSNEERVIDKFINSNLKYDGNGSYEILARAFKTQKDAKKLINCYKDIEKLEKIGDIEDSLKQDLIYLYLKEKDGRFYSLENVDIRSYIISEFEDILRDAKYNKNEKKYEINIGKLNFNYSYKPTEEIDDWKDWLSKTEAEEQKTNHDILLEKIASKYQAKLKSILYKDDNGIKFSRSIFSEENKEFIISALEVNKVTQKERIDSFFSEDFNNLLKDNSLGNMTLLTGNKVQTESSGQNQIVSNNTYREKKDKVYNFFKEGQFVPIGTLLVFTDIYTKEHSISDYWLPNSRLAYLKDMIRTITSFIGEKKTNE